MDRLRIATWNICWFANLFDEQDRLLVLANTIQTNRVAFRFFRKVFERNSVYQMLILFRDAC